MAVTSASSPGPDSLRAPQDEIVARQPGAKLLARPNIGDGRDQALFAPTEGHAFIKRMRGATARARAGTWPKLQPQSSCLGRKRTALAFRRSRVRVPFGPPLDNTETIGCRLLRYDCGPISWLKAGALDGSARV